MRFDVNDLTLEELCDLEDAIGDENLYGKLAEGKVSAKAMVGLVWIIRRRDEPGFSFDDAKKLKVTDLNIEVADAPG